LSFQTEGGRSNPNRASLRLKGEGMSKLAVSTSKVRADEQPSGGRVDSTEAFVYVFNEVRAELVSTLFFVLGNHDDAQDAAQDAFMKCWRTQETFPEVRNLRAWIFRVGLNAAKDLQRNAWRRRAKPLGDNAAPEVKASPAPAEVLQERETLESLRQALHHLRTEEKEVFLLRQNGDLTYEEIAKLRRTPVGTIKTQMRSALQKLRRVLKEPVS
jgi:RNA polymerase sigma-70 factor (ECF subfamily)